MKHLPFITIVLACSFFITACDTEKDDVIAPVEDLSNTFIKSVTIINIPPFNWDNGSSPDLYLILSLFSDTNIVYFTNQVDNVEKVPDTLYFSQHVPLFDDIWQINLIDQDDINDHDVIYKISSNLYKNASNGKIPIIIDDLLLMEFNYSTP